MYTSASLDFSSGSPELSQPWSPPRARPSCFEEPALPFQMVPGVQEDILLFLSLALRELVLCTPTHGLGHQGGQGRGWGQAGGTERKR